MGLYCGRNEGNPPPVLNEGLEKLVASLHPGIRYIPNSAFGVVSGGGPYHLMPVKFYFDQRATPKLHSELGMANIVGMDSLRQMMPVADQWPQGRVWGLHDFTTRGAQRGGALRETIRKTYGDAGERGGVGGTGAVHELRRASRDVRGPEQAPHGRSHVDEPPLLALVRLADLRLLPRAHRRLFRREEGLRAAARPVEPAERHRGSRELQRRSSCRGSMSGPPS